MGDELDTSRYLASRASLERDGFVVLPASFFPFSTPVEALRDSANRCAELARAGKWPYIRTLPKQFPPWTADPSQGIWGVQHLLHPDLPDHATFARSYFDKQLLQQVRFLIGCEPDELVMELYNLLVRPDRDFALRWHRDDIPATATPEEEMERLGKPAFHAQWNLALYDDTSLIVVPGSHKRARTEVERTADPYEDNMPGQKIVHLNPGDVVFYDNNILHRGKYDATVPRMTLHGSIGYDKGSKDRARNVLQHAVGEWVERCDFSDLGPEMSKVADGMRSRLVEMGKVSGDVGFFSKEE
ncbi:phytanoyl-CoA dioxygenase family protein [Glonium stellatum]|uniref:Phytanoyl-CoA dioxygenase family protein n=1 Tax=Glonium stellatum TaxID=574774 RepID=A0A8E2JYC8_9PEZI|nr:phytanoyl-CoA dioxygenase family protein [Glonium stellatum]